MMTITPAQMKELEGRFMEAHGIPGALLMEHAAQGVVQAMLRHAGSADTALFLCGPGNNGGDGYAAARLWAAQGGRSEIIELTDQLRGDALTMRTLARMTPGVTITHVRDMVNTPPAQIVVDALFGTGLSREPEGDAAELIHRANEKGVPIVAVDVPSGLCALTGAALSEEVIHATETVTFHRIKQGLVLRDGPDCTGRITVQPILIPPYDDIDGEYDGMDVMTPDVLRVPEGVAPKNLFPYHFRRMATAHKGDMGRCVLFCGSRGMAGAAALCANAALRTGAGLTVILCRESLLAVLQTLAPGATCRPLPERNGCLTPEAAGIAREALVQADAACIGCGLGQTGDVMPVLRQFLEAPCPVVWDADALNLLARNTELLPLKEEDVITPHPGEAARLLDVSAREVTADAPAALDNLHDLCGCTVLLKGARSLITDGIETAVNVYGTPAMAKGGSGDVLAGIITALLARRMPEMATGRMSSMAAAQYGSLIHGLAGLRAEKRLGENGVLPTDLIYCIRLDDKEL